MTELAVRMADLPSIGAAALPANYHAATEALAQCNRIDECKDWADKMAALASYAKQADDQTLHHLAVRISARAIRRCGELLQAFENQGARTDKQLLAGTHEKLTQRQAAAGAGMSPHQELQAVRVANVPAEAFEAAIECEHPATVTQLAELGTTARPVKFSQATHVIGVLRELVLYCAEHDASSVGCALFPHEVAPLRADVEALVTWMRDCLEATTC